MLLFTRGRLYNQMDSMTLETGLRELLGGGAHLRRVTSPVRKCQTTSCEGLSDIQCDITAGVLSSRLCDRRGKMWLSGIFTTHEPQKSQSGNKKRHFKFVRHIFTLSLL